MSAKKIALLSLISFGCFLPMLGISAESSPSTVIAATAGQSYPSLARDTLASQLGWQWSDENNCGGFYIEAPFHYTVDAAHQHSVEVTSDQTLFSQRGTSILEGQVVVNRYGQQLTSKKAYLYRDPVTGKLSAIDLIGNVHFREPNTLVIAKVGRYDFQTKSKSLSDAIYRTSMIGNTVVGPKVSQAEMQTTRKVTTTTAWGRAGEFRQAEPRIYELKDASYSTCSPAKPTWILKGSHIVLNKNTGRGYATNVRILVHGIPVFYSPYLNFPIDKRRKTGFLFPTIGAKSNWGPFVLAPFYWNMAPNYDLTITPGWLEKRGVQLANYFRYLTSTSSGSLYASVLPNDHLFATFQENNRINPPVAPPGQSPNVTNAEVNRLFNASDTRRSFRWREASFFNPHWSSHVDINYVSDDYYLRDFGENFNQLTANQLLQEGDIYYKNKHWNFTGRLQAYQTLHPYNVPQVLNVYKRFPQFILNADYPDEKFGLEYFLNSEVTHFDYLKTPGMLDNYPVGNRFHVQPGVSLPLSWPYFYITPRFQLALSEYDLHNLSDTISKPNLKRAVPIMDVASGFLFTRDVHFLNTAYQQTLEPQFYYTYIPYRNQARIPIFDTTVNTLTYDQIFNYNRFTGIDRIGDANQLGIGLTSRLIDQESGFEKVRIGVGGIIYFANRLVTLCTKDTPNCTNISDVPSNHSNYQRLSPLTGVIDYHINPSWSANANAIWNPISKQLDNTTVGLHYEPAPQHIINLTYSYARGGDILSGIAQNDPSNNLKSTDFSFAWPVFENWSMVGRWSQNWNHRHLQNLLYGVQYDTCCWAVRFVGGRSYVGIDPTNHNKPKYIPAVYLQFSLKGLGNVGRDPSGPLSTIAGYNTQFGQEF